MQSKANEMLRDILSYYNVTAQQFREVQESHECDFLHNQPGDIAVFRIERGNGTGRDIFVERFGCRGDTPDWDYVSMAELYTLSNAEKAYAEYCINDWFFDIEPGLSWKFWDDHDFYAVA